MSRSYGPAQLILAGQVDHIVGEVECYSLQREIGERNLQLVDSIAIAIGAKERCTTIRADSQLPKLEIFLGYMRLVLGNCDSIEQPVSSSALSQKSRSIGVQNGPIDCVSVPVFGTDELPELRFGECCCVFHIVPLSLKCPRRGECRHNAAVTSAAVIAFWGNRDNGVGEPKQRH